MNKIFKQSFFDNAFELLKSTEGLADELNAPIPGENKSDADIGEKFNNSNEQNNEFTDDNDNNQDSFGSLDDSVGGDDSLGGDDSSNSNDTSSMGDMNTEEKIDFDKNPFKERNGKGKLDNMLLELQNAVEDSLHKINLNQDISGTVVVSDLENLIESVKNIRQTVFMLPVETTMYKYRLCVKEYELISKHFKEVMKKNIKVD